MGRTLNILYQSNDFYAVTTGVSMTSLLENNKDIDTIHFYILDDRISMQNKQKMALVCRQYSRSITFVNTGKFLKTFNKLKVATFKNTYTTYFKLIAINKLPVKTGRILQLDGDTIINGSLKELCDIDLGDYICAATYDSTICTYKGMIDIPLTDKYYNCGVLLINQKEWIKYKCWEKIVEHLTSVRNGYCAGDQDIINVLFRNKIKYLDLKYNFNSGFYIYGIKELLNMYNLKPEYHNTSQEVSIAAKTPIIYHCMGAMTGRPWEQDSIHPQNDIFDYYLAMSPWCDFEKVKVDRKIIFKIQRILYRILPKKLYIPLHKMALKRYLSNMNQSVQKKGINKV